MRCRDTAETTKYNIYINRCNDERPFNVNVTCTLFYLFRCEKMYYFRFHGKVKERKREGAGDERRDEREYAGNEYIGIVNKWIQQLRRSQNQTVCLNVLCKRVERRSEGEREMDDCTRINKFNSSRHTRYIWKINRRSFSFQILCRWEEMREEVKQKMKNSQKSFTRHIKYVRMFDDNIEIEILNIARIRFTWNFDYDENAFTILLSRLDCFVCAAKFLTAAFDFFSNYFFPLNSRARDNVTAHIDWHRQCDI